MIILADDLTGANDTAIQYTQFGLKTIVMTQFNQSIDFHNFEKYHVVSCNLNSRMLGKEEAYEVVKDAATAFCSQTNTMIYKKIDSLLRGNPGPELKAVMDVTHADIAFIVPAYPQNNRIVKNGEILSSLENVNVAERFEDSTYVSKIITVKDLENSPQFLAKKIGEDYKAGVRLFIFDSIVEGHFVFISEISKFLQLHIIYCGSAGFAPYLLSDKEMSQTLSCRNTWGEHEKILIVCGTRNPITQQQLHYALEHFQSTLHCLEVNEDDQGKAIDQVSSAVISSFEEGKTKVFLGVSSVFDDVSFLNLIQEDTSEKAQIITNQIGCIVNKVFDRIKFSALFVTGGDTALKVSNSLGAFGMIPLREISPGVPLVTLVGGRADGVYMITKSGGFGDEKTIAHSIEYLGGIKNEN